MKSVLDAINKRFGDNSVMILGEAEALDVDVISTGSIEIDKALGVGGIPRGRITEIAGLQSSGKTTLMIQTMVEAQRSGGNVAFIDVEHAFDAIYAESLGLNVDAVAFSQPESAEEAMEISEMLVSSGDFVLVVLDSVGALACKAELEGDMGDSHIGLVARLMSQAMRKLTHVVSKTNTALVLLNQFRDNVNTTGFGPKRVTCGGKAIPFFSSVRIEVIRISQLKDKKTDVEFGFKGIVKIIKNKLAAPMKIANVEMIFGKGFCPVNEAVTIAIAAGIIKQGGAWYTYGEDKINGKAAMMEFFYDRPEEVASIIEQITGG